MRVTFVGEPVPGVGAKDYALALIGEIGTGGGTGSVIEYAGPAIEALSMEGRMTLCNLSIEGGAKAGLIAADDKTFAYIQGKPGAPKGAAWDMAVDYWRSFFSDADARFDREITIDVSKLVPTLTWGTSPEDVMMVTGLVPDPDSFATEDKRAGGGAGAGLYGPDRRPADHRRRHPAGVHRLLHQQPHRGPAPGRLHRPEGSGPGPQGSPPPCGP